MIKNLFKCMTKKTSTPKQEVLLFYDDVLYLNHLLCLQYKKHPKLGIGLTNWLCYCFQRLDNFESVSEMRTKLYQFTYHPSMDKLFYDMFIMELEDIGDIILLTKFCKVFGVEAERGKNEISYRERRED